MTKKRKSEFKVTYKIIDGLKKFIIDLQIEIETHLKFGNLDEAKSKEELIKTFESTLYDLKNKGWEIDYTQNSR